MPDDIMDYLVPAIPGFYFMGNGNNDLFNYLPRDALDDGRISTTEIDAAIRSRLDGLGLTQDDLHPLDLISLRHDRDTIDPETGERRDTLGLVERDLELARDGAQAFFDDPIGNFLGIGVAVFGVGAAVYSAFSGFASQFMSFASDFVSRAIEGIGDFFRGLFDPIVLDLDGDGVELVGLDDSTATFDFDDDGLAERVGWVGADDGLLVFDADGNGIIDAADEVAFVGYLEGARTDLEGLSAFDSDGDGQLTEADAAEGGFDWSQFQVWRDANQNGRSDAGELISLADAGIVSIALGLNGDASEVDGNLIHNTTTFTRADGTVGAAADVSFATHTYAAETVAVGDHAVGVATDMGASALFISADSHRGFVQGTDQNDTIIFSEFDDVFLVSGGEGHDRIVFAGEIDDDDLSFTLLRDEGLIVFRNEATGESFFVADDVEQITFGSRTYDLEPLWT